jgi:ABC-type branched-subunit amino acid transport system substrate-binding protein
MAPNSETGFLPYLATKGIPVVGGLGVPQQENQPTMFLTFTAWSKQARMAGALTPYLGCKQPAVWLVDLPFTAPLAGPLKEAMTKANCPPVGDPEIISAVQPDYTNYVLKARQQGAQSVIMALDPGSIQRAVRGIRNQGWNVPLVLSAPSNTLVEEALGKSLDGAFMTSVFLNPEAHANAPGVKRWLGIVKKYYPNDFTDPYTQQSYVSALVTVEALKRAGPNPTWKSFIAAMESIKNFDTGLSLPMSYSKSGHDPLQCMELLQRRNGRWVAMVNHWICADGSKPPLPA